MRFTADDAFEASECGDPIMMERPAVLKLCAEHHADPVELFADCGEKDQYDAAEVLGWLGY